MPEINFVTQIKGDKQVVSSLEQIDKSIDATGRDAKKASQEFDKAFKSVGVGTKTASGEFERLGHSVLDFTRNPMMAAQNAISGLLTKLGPLAIGIGAVATAAGAGALALFHMGEAAASEAESLKNLSAMTGQTIQDLQAMRQITKEAGLEGIDLGRIMGQLNDQLGSKEGGDFTKALVDLDIALLDSNGNTKDAVKLLDELRDKFLDIEDPAERAQKANAAIGGRLRELIPLILNSNDSLASQIETMKATGPVWDEITQKKLEAFDDALDRIGRTWTSFVTDIKAGIGSMLGSFTQLAESTKKVWENLTDIEKVKLGKASQPGLSLFDIGSPFTSVDVKSLEDAPKIARDLFVEQQKLIAKNEEHLGIKLQLITAQKEFDNLVNRGTREQIAAQAQILAGLNAQLKTVEGAKGAMTAYLDATDSLWKGTSDSIERINLALRPNSEMDGYFASINAGLDGAITRLATIEAEASRIDPDKLMADIAKSTMEMTEVSAEILSEDFERQQELIRETERQYKEMIEDVRDGAGEVFDAIVSRGEDAFTNLGDWIEATFLSRLRKLFQNFIEWMSGGFKGGFEQVLAGIAPSLGGLGGGDSAFAELQQIMGGGGGETYGRQSGIFGLSGSLGSLVQSGLMMGGSWAFMDSFKQKGARGWLESIGGGAALGASIGSVIPGIGTAIGAAVGAAVGAISKGIQSIAKAITGPNSYEATSKEISRDFGGIGVSDKEVQSWMSSVGLKENQVWDIRQNMKTSPSFLYEVAWAAAEAQGKTEEFLTSLERVGTSWGEFNFRTAFEIGRLTGDWSKLNEMWMETSNLGDAFKDMPAVLDNLLLGDGTLPEYEQLVKDLYELQAAIQGTLPATLDMYDTFLQTGEITDEFAEKIKELGGNIEEWRAASATITGNTAQIASLLAVSTALAGLKNSIAATTAGVGTMYEKFLETGEISEELASQITDLGGDLAAFQSMSRLQAISSEYAQLVEHFRESGEILPRLSELFAEFGGNVSALSMDSFDLSGLTDRLSFVQSLVSQLKSSLPDPIATLLSGKMDADVIASLTGAGLDPSAFGNLMSVIGKRNQFSASNFQAFQEMNPELEYYLKQYGGSAGATALSRYGMGQNTITSGLLNDVQMNIEKEYQDEVKKLLEYLGTVEGETQSEIDRLTQVMDDQLTALEDQFATVGGNIEKALNDSKVGVMSEIDLMIGSIQTQTQTLSDAINDAKEGIVSAIDSLISGAITQGASGSAQSNNSVTVQIDMSGSYVANSAAFYQDMAQAMETYFKNGGSLEMLGAR